MDETAALTDALQESNAAAILENFTIDAMKFSDGETGQMFWCSSELVGSLQQLSAGAVDLRLPVAMAMCPAIVREITFSSVEVIRNLIIHERVWVADCVTHERMFEFGLVIPKSTNTWSTVAYADPHETPHEPEECIDQIVLELQVLTGQALLCTI